MSRLPAKLTLSIMSFNEDIFVCSTPSLPFVFKLVDACGGDQVAELSHEGRMYEELARAGGADLTVRYHGTVRSPQGYNGILLEKGTPCSAWKDVSRFVFLSPDLPPEMR